MVRGQGGTSLCLGLSVNQNGQKPRYLRFSLAGENLIHSQGPLMEGMDVSWIRKIMSDLGWG